MHTALAVPIAGVLLLAAMPLQAAMPAWRQGGHAGVVYDSNPAQVRSGAVRQPSGFFAAGVRAEREGRPGEQLGLLLRLSLDGEGYARHERLSNARAGLMLRGSWRPAAGFYAPLFALWGSAAHAEFGSGIRSGAEYRGGIFVQEQLTTTLRARLGAQWSDREASGGVFDLRGHSVGLNLDWASGGAANAYLGYQYYDGGLVSTNRPSPVALRAASAVAPDDAFGGAAADQFAFLLRSHAQLATLGFNYAFTRACALDAQWQDSEAHANTGSRYRRSFATLSLLFRF